MITFQVDNMVHSGLYHFILLYTLLLLFNLYLYFCSILSKKNLELTYILYVLIYYITYVFICDVIVDKYKIIFYNPANK